MKILKKLRKKLSIFMRKFRFEQESSWNQNGKESDRDQLGCNEGSG